MRFVIAIILVAVFAAISLAVSRGFSNIAVLVSYMVGGAIIAPSIIAGLFCLPKSGRNNKRFFRVFNVVLLLSILGHVGELNELYGKPPKTIVGTNGKLEMTIPASWSQEVVPNENVLFKLKNRSGYLNILIGYERMGENPLPLNRYAQLMGERFKNDVPDFGSISDIKQCASTKLACVYQIVITTTGEKGTATVMATLSGQKRYYNFMAVTNPGLLESYMGDIFKTLQSINEINK